jgi:hypothetical protein
MKVTASFVRVSHICSRVSQVRSRLDQYSHPNVTVVRAANKHLFTALAHVHAINHLLMTGMPAYPLSSLDVPARQVHICGCGEDDFGVARPVQIQHGLLVSGQNAVVLA